MDGLFYRAPENLYADDGSDGHDNEDANDNDEGHDNEDDAIQGLSYCGPMIDAMTNMDNRCKRLKSANKINSYNPANSVFRSETNNDWKILTKLQHQHKF